ncbi:GRTP1 [Symbiodinium pilosum]|uniref:GRTP1 protein n=1 Tax=Symbiodinium pilosum TaxID=2952 RepID=A0A812N2M9_SYMPI|nr:GRTP1 [Symbiodinium pilosum]
MGGAHGRHSRQHNAEANPRRSRGVRSRVRACFGLERRDLRPIHPLVAPLLEQKRAASARRYNVLVSQAEAGAVPDEVAHQIRLDVVRTFPAIPSPHGDWGWPRDIASQDREDCLARALLASECRSAESSRPSSPQKSGLPMLLKIRRSWCGVTAESSSSTAPLMRRQSLSLGADGWAVDTTPSLSDPMPTYVQGCSMMAAMCLGFTVGREEEGFWLFIHLLEDVLGADFFSRQPALVGFHGDRAAAAALVASQSPGLAELMGVHSLGESISALASRCLLSGFVGFLSGPPLVAFWEELLQVRCADFPRLPLITWLAGLVHHAEGQLASALVGLSSDEAVPVFFRTVQQAAKALPNNWHPRIRVSRAHALELRQISKAAAERYRSTQEALNLKESHAKNVSASLDRTCSALLDAMKLAEGMGSASAAAAGSSREAKDHTTCLGSRTHAKCQSTQAPAHIGDNARSHSVVRWYAII